ncbi:MAG: threonylcarbamoyl-AMP synthase [Deltaproteobacteria bacterium]|nr:threonylcarbamoyl-AMP synthase [Deltaproteobacteria bacterium]
MDSTPTMAEQAEQLEAAVLRAADAIRAGGLVVYPTETIYALGADAGNAEAVQRLLAAKGRDDGRGMSVLVADLEQARVLLATDPVDTDPGTEAVELARRWWPGPLTLVLPAAAGLPRGLVGETGGVGLRCSSDPVAAALLKAAGVALTATSANPSSLEPARSVQTAREYFGDSVACYVDDGPRVAESASTVVEFLDGRAYLRRSGSVDVKGMINVQGG